MSMKREKLKEGIIMKTMKTKVYLVHGLGVENSHEWWGSTKSELQRVYPEIDFEYYDYETSKWDTFLNKAKTSIGVGKVLDTLENIGKNFITRIDTRDKEFDNIILFGHSMGGLVAANAINYANSIPELSHVKDKLSNLIMCGTPLGGSDLADKASYIPGHSPHVKELLKDSCARMLTVDRMKNFVSVNKEDSDKTLLSFLPISGDEVVQTPEEIFGIYEHQLGHIHVRNLIGTHSGAVKNLEDKSDNFTIIVDHLKKCFDTAYLRIDPKKSVEEYTNYTHAIKALEIKEQAYREVAIKKLTDLQHEEIDKASAETLPEVNTFINLDVFFRKTFLKNKKLILDLDRKIKVIDDTRDTTFEFYTGFDLNSKRSKDCYIDALINRLNKVKNTETNRFTEYSLDIKKIEKTGNGGNNTQTTTVRNIKISKTEYSTSKGFTIFINLGKYNVGSEIELLMAFTLPTTIKDKYNKENKCIDATECKEADDRITVPSTIVKTKVIIQEETYGGSAPLLMPRVLGGESNIINEIDTVSSYYKQYIIESIFDPENGIHDEPIKMEIYMSRTN